MPRLLSRLLSRLLPLTLVLLAACVPLGKGEKGDAPVPVPADEISVTPLPKAGALPAVEAPPAAGVADPAEGDAAPADPATATPPGDPATPVAEIPPEAAPPAPPPPPPSPEALACQRKGGEYRGTGVGTLKACVRATGEGTKRCTKQTDCKGLCLARSGTCAPVTPLFGCNDILQADGRRATLCVD